MAGYALSAARRNRWQRAASVLATIGGAVFVVCTAYGRPTIGIAAVIAVPGSSRNSESLSRQAMDEYALPLGSAAHSSGCMARN